MEWNGEYRTRRRKDAVASEGSGFGNNPPVPFGPSDPMVCSRDTELPVTLPKREFIRQSHKSRT
jgi:hypothetical protein